MTARILILFLTTLAIALESIFLPCDYVNQSLPYQPDAGYHTLSNMNTEMTLDLDALVYEICGTLAAGAVALMIVKRRNRAKGVSYTAAAEPNK